MMFIDRIDAGRRLGARLGHLRGADVVVLGLPRGGVPVAFEVARALDAPLDVIVVRKLGVPFQPELGMGAIGEDGVRVIDEEIATGSTARAACQVARAHGAKRVTLAVPVAPPDWTDRLGRDADELICLRTPTPFAAIGQWYGDFSQTSDEEVVDCLRQAAALAAQTTGMGGTPTRDEEIQVRAGPVRLAGRLTGPDDPCGFVMFVHGSGSSRYSPRNHFVATALNRAGLGTLLFDFEEPGALEAIAQLAREWFIDHLARSPQPATRP